MIRYNDFKNVNISYQGKVITENIEVNGLRFLVLKNKKCYPVGLFGYGSYFRDVIPIEGILYWLKSRIFPPNRIDRKDILKEMGEKNDHYDPISIIIETGGSSVSDKFSLEFLNDKITK